MGEPLEYIGLCRVRTREVQGIDRGEDQTEASKDGSGDAIEGTLPTSVPDSKLVDYEAKKLEQKVAEYKFEDEKTVKDPHTEEMGKEWRQSQFHQQIKWESEFQPLQIKQSYLMHLRVANYACVVTNNSHNLESSQYSYLSEFHIIWIPIDVCVLLDCHVNNYSNCR